MSFWQKCVVVLLGVAIFGGAAYFARIAFRPVELARFESIPWVKYVHPNVKRLKQAQDLAHDGKLHEEQALLVKALVIAPKSPLTGELRDLLANVNAQIFFSKEPSPRKTEYIVKQGDALSSIARKLDSSPEAIIRINNLDSTLIRPGQKLLVPRLDFAITVDLPDNRLVMQDSGGGFFTQYPIVSVQLPPMRRSAVQTKVATKSFWGNGKLLQADHGMQKEGTPRIDLGHPGYVLYGVGEERQASTSGIAVSMDDNGQTTNSLDANRPPQGIAMMKEDIADIALLSRKGTPVTIILNQDSSY